jgi:Transposase IS66 family
VLTEPVIDLDHTSWPRVDGKGETPWQMWCLTSPGVVVHRIREDKSANTFRDLMGSYAGTIVCDALKTHEAGARGKRDERVKAARNETGPATAVPVPDIGRFSTLREWCSQRLRRTRFYADLVGY